MLISMPTHSFRNLDEPMERRDSAGNAIAGAERHKIMFRDKVDKNTRICDVYLVESYKKYNQMEYEEDTIICKCSIF